MRAGPLAGADRFINRLQGRDYDVIRDALIRLRAAMPKGTEASGKGASPPSLFILPPAMAGDMPETAARPLLSLGRRIRNSL
jgi:hypothetical protein